MCLFVFNIIGQGSGIEVHHFLTFSGNISINFYFLVSRFGIILEKSLYPKIIKISTYAFFFFYITILKYNYCIALEYI